MLESPDLKEIYDKMRELKADQYKTVNAAEWVDTALKEFIVFIATYLDDKVSLVAYVYKLVFVQFNL
jgi:hypothetical protein